ncbi:MAG: hypothetical protein JEZ14_03585 [Marinilabiliaceae bacterium]|nr:hypothetical protein [Marinilabiliaceae bacterium]
MNKYFILICILISGGVVISCNPADQQQKTNNSTMNSNVAAGKDISIDHLSPNTSHQIYTKAEKGVTSIDTLAYCNKLKALANGDTTGLWPIKTHPFPVKGAILPFKRIVAYYGNLYSKRMGILGEYPPKEMWKRLNSEVRAWQETDSTTPVQPALHYIAVVAQSDSMRDGRYCLRMPDNQIDSVLTIAKMGNAIIFLDIQVGHSNVRYEVPLLNKYLKMPQVHLSIDPEFSMKEGHIPGRKIGTMNARDINFCSEYLAKLVKEYKLSPKILIVHRFTQGMVRNYKNIVLRPEVQIVMHMDGWGGPTLKRSSYTDYIYREPVQFTGFKLFYKNDLRKPPHRLLTPTELMQLKPQPIYIQYQ